MKTSYRSHKSGLSSVSTALIFTLIASVVFYVYLIISSLANWYSVMHNNSSIITEALDLLTYSDCDFNFNTNTVEFKSVDYILVEGYAFLSEPVVVRADSSIYLFTQPSLDFILYSSGNSMGSYSVYLISAFSIIISLVYCVHLIGYNKTAGKLTKFCFILLTLLLLFFNTLLYLIVFMYFI